MNKYKIGDTVKFSNKRTKIEVTKELNVLGKLPRKKKKEVARLLKLNKESLLYQIVNISTWE